MRLDAAERPRDEEGPHITFPIPRSRLLVGREGSTEIKLAATGGVRPYRWMVDGKPVESRPFARETAWRPDGIGFSTVAVVDALGRGDQTSVRVVDGAP